MVRAVALQLLFPWRRWLTGCSVSVLALTSCTELRPATERRDVVSELAVDSSVEDAPMDVADAQTAPDVMTVDVPPADVFVMPDPATIEPPRPVMPLSGLAASSSTPLIKWAFAPGSTTTGARVELCEDRDCTVPIATVNAADGATEVRLDVAPTRRRLFWRLRGLVRTFAGSRTSVSWLLLINPTPTPRNALQRAHLDVNNDGYADVMVGAPGAISFGVANAGRAYLYPGRGAAPGVVTAAPADFNIDGSWDNMRGANVMGTSVAIVGDMNGDGAAEMLGGSPCGAYNTGSMMCGPGRAKLDYGRSSGVATSTTTFNGITNGSQFGAAVTGLSDFNGDGLADAAIGAPVGGASSRGEVWLVRGTRSGSPSAGVGPTPSDLNLTRYGLAVSSAGDVNGDGLTDLLVGAPNSQGLIGRAYIIFGSAAWTSGPPPATLTAIRINPPMGVSGGLFGAALAAAGDVDGDGYGDFLIGSPTNANGSAFLYFGRADAASTTSWDTIQFNGTVAAQRFGGALAGVGDLNGDGFDDIAIGGAPSTPMTDTPVQVFLGGPTGLRGPRPTQPATTLSPVAAMALMSTTGNFGAAVTGGGDLDGDGLTDLIIGAPLAPAFTDPMGGSWIMIGGRALVYFGARNATGIRSTTPVVLPETEMGTFVKFGSSLS